MAGKVRRVRGNVNYKGIVEKGKNYIIKDEEGYDWYKLHNGTYIPKFTVGPIYEDDEGEFEEEYNSRDSRNNDRDSRNNRNDRDKRNTPGKRNGKLTGKRNVGLHRPEQYIRD